MITDNNMPNLTGMELLKKLYATRMALPFIMATGKCRRENSPNIPVPTRRHSAQALHGRGIVGER